MKKLISIVFILLFVSGCTGCSSLYYHPVKDYYINPARLTPPPEIVNFKSEDGVELVGWYFPARTAKSKGFIVHFHGNAQNVSSHFLFLIPAPREGYDYFIFDYRGFGQSQGKPTPAGVVKDGRSALRWAANKAKERGNLPLIVFMQSLGGAIGMRSMATLPEPIGAEAVIVDSSFSSYRSAARGVAAQSWLLWLFQPLAWSIMDNSESPEADLANLKAKNFLVVHGTSDYIINSRLGERVFEKLPEPKEFWKIEGGQHTDFLLGHDKKFEKQFYVWLDSKVK